MTFRARTFGILTLQASLDCQLTLQARTFCQSENRQKKFMEAESLPEILMRSTQIANKTKREASKSTTDGCDEHNTENKSNTKRPSPPCEVGVTEIECKAKKCGIQKESQYLTIGYFIYRRRDAIQFI